MICYRMKIDPSESPEIPEESLTAIYADKDSILWNRSKPSKTSLVDVNKNILG